MNKQQKLLFAFLAGIMTFSGSLIANAENALTPYPTVDKDWPGKGVIRKFGWMDDNRKWFWTQREKNQSAVVFAGDSLTAGWKSLAKDFPNIKVANRGIGGDVSRGLLFRFKEDILDLNPKAIVINIGTNDLTAHGNIPDIIENINKMLKMTKHKNPKIPVILCIVPPCNNPKAPLKPGAKELLNDGIRKLADGKDNVSICDLYQATTNPDGSQNTECFGADKLHLSAKGYEKWTETIKPIFEKLNIK